MGTARLKPSINATAYHPIFFDTSKSLSVIDKDHAVQHLSLCRHPP